MFHLKELRQYKSITQSDLGKALNISPSAIGMYEQGRREPDAEILVKIADFFDVTTDYLLGRKPKGAVKCYSQDEHTLLCQYRELSESHKEDVLLFVSHFHAQDNPVPEKIDVEKRAMY